MLIDIHAHYIPSEVLREQKPDEAWRPRIYRDDKGKQWVEHAGTSIGSATREFVDIARILEEQDRAGIDLVALSPWSSVFNYDQPVEAAQRACRLQNDAIAARVRDHPKRLAGMGCVPLQEAEVAAREAEYIVRDLRLHGIGIGTNVNGIYLGDERFLPFWEKIAELDTFVFIHPVPGVGGALMREYELWNLYGNPAETGLTAASLIFGGVLERLPNLRILLAHGGGVLPYLIGRFDQGWQVRPAAKKARITQAPSEYLRRFYFDTIVFSPDTLRYLVQLVGVEHILIGTDYPFDMGYSNPRPIVEGIGLSEAQQEMIFSGTAKRLLKIGLYSK